jgi:predicted TIM-barrel fold metal-dependent hydrolase
MTEIALFDSLSHPTLSGKWMEKVDASFEMLVGQLHEAGFARACAVGIANHDDYQHSTFAERCKKYPELVPIAGVMPKAAGVIDIELDMVKALGFRGIKLHPRYSDFSYGDVRLIDTFRAATRRGLAVFLCTYFHTPIDRYPDADPLYSVVKILKASPDTRLVLVHGGCVELLRWMQLARHTSNILLDISLTMMRYAGSSLDLDLRYLFSSFHDRTCLGTDFPDFTPAQVRARFEDLSRGASLEASRKIGGLNLARFLNTEINW